MSAVEGRLVTSSRRAAAERWGWWVGAAAVIALAFGVGPRLAAPASASMSGISAMVPPSQEAAPGAETASEGYGIGIVSMASLAGACAKQECQAQAGYGYPEDDVPARH